MFALYRVEYIVRNGKPRLRIRHCDAWILQHTLSGISPFSRISGSAESGDRRAIENSSMAGEKQ